jgi:uncharacterized protein (TIGR03000 family)
MRKWMIVSVLTLAGVLGGSSRASAWWGCGWYGCGGWWGCGYPAFSGYAYGYGPASYYYPWYYPWFSYWNYSYSPYAWPYGYVAGNYPAYVPGMASYSTPAAYAGMGVYAQASNAETKPATVTATLPADAELLFNGHAASGASGATRSFLTTPLAQGQSYEYTLSARIKRDGKTELITEKVVVKAGEVTKVSLMPKGDASAVAAK